MLDCGNCGAANDVAEAHCGQCGSTLTLDVRPRHSGSNEVSTSRALRAARGETPMVGRDRELEILRGFWRQAVDGAGRTLLVEGHQGVGKSRLVGALKRELSASTRHHQRLQYYCAECHVDTAFHPLIGAVSQTIRQIPDLPDQTAFDKLTSFLVQFAIDPDHAPAFAQVLGIEPPADARIQADAETIKQLITEDWFELIGHMSEQEPLLLILEDAHWIDPATRDLILKLATWSPHHRILAIVTRRTGLGFPQGSLDNFHTLSLERLDQGHCRSMISQIVGDAALPGELVEHIILETGGIPLYIEELTRTIMDSGMSKQREDHHELSGPLSN